MVDLGQLRVEDPRGIWRDEARDFTPWLAQHLEDLGKVLGIDLELVEQEKDVGRFSIDILARDLGRNRLVVIENQLEVTDHNHLGQILTYAAGIEAGTVVWVSREVRPEHRKAIDWLNRGFEGKAEFFGVLLEVICIDTSRPAVNFRLVAAPNEWSPRRPGIASGGEPSDRQQAYQRFFQRLIDELREKHRFTNAKAGQPQNWYSFSAGTKGFTYGVSFAQGGRLRSDLYIDVGDADQNEAVLTRLRKDQGHLEKEFGETLTWENLDTKRACRIACYREGTIEDPQDRLDEYHAWAIDRVLRFHRVFGPLLTSAVSDSQVAVGA